MPMPLRVAVVIPLAAIALTTVKAFAVDDGGPTARWLEAGHIQDGQTGTPTYRVRKTIRLGFEGGRVAVDYRANRAYLVSPDGLRPVDLTTGTIGEIALRGRFVGDLAFAPDIGRLFAGMESDRVAFIDVRSMEILHTIEIRGRGRIVYEPLLQQVYVLARRAPTVQVFDALTAAAVTTVDLPGSGGTTAILVPGRLLVKLDGEDELAIVDTATKELSFWLLPTDFSRFSMAADASGRTLFMSTDRTIRAFDTTSRQLTGEIVIGGPSFIVWDPAADVLLVTYRPASRPGYRLSAVRHDERGLTEVSGQDLPPQGTSPPTPTSGGFVNSGMTGNVGAMGTPDLRHHFLLVWDRVDGRVSLPLLVPRRFAAASSWRGVSSRIPR